MSLVRRERSRLLWVQLFLCPVIIVVGTVMRVFTGPDNWSADKDSTVNIWFIKQGWAWTSAVCWWCVVRYRGLGGRTLRQTALRYVALTAWWYAFTQAIWFGIAPIMDQVFTSTGGHCNFDVFDAGMGLNTGFHDSEGRRTRSLQKLLQWFTTHGAQGDELRDRTLYWIQCLLSGGQCENTGADPAEINSHIQNSVTASAIRSSHACARLGGHWMGGHDPSGHVFLITLMCMFMLGELQVFGRRAMGKLAADCQQLQGTSSGMLVRILQASPIRAVLSPEDTQHILKRLFFELPLEGLSILLSMVIFGFRFVVLENPIIMLLGLILTWTWSLMVTILSFHSFAEHLTGLLFAYLVVLALYWYI
ncbi:AaceriAAR165Wp [[Ashbya] aceris (nom. inval.)]|nr:AaceriAAR165Wp [[Ashbya] aceris (nom. inval.)]